MDRRRPGVVGVGWGWCFSFDQEEVRKERDAVTNFMGFLGDEPIDVRDPAYMSRVDAEGVPLDPQPGSVPVTNFSWDQLNKIVQQGLTAWSDTEKNKLLTKIAMRQRQQKPTYLPISVVNGTWTAGEKVALGIGGLALAAGIGFAIYYFIGKKGKRK
jgi:hypothetical protein